MASQRLQVSFNDSSDSANSHLASLDVVPDGSGYNESSSRDNASMSDRPDKNRQGGKGSGWLGDLIIRGIEALTGGGAEPSHEPFSAEQLSSREGSSAGSSDNSSSRGSGDWGYGVRNHNHHSTSIHSSSITADDSLSDTSRARQQPPENYQINLRESVLQFLRTPEELYLSFILATLKAGTAQVTADVFRAAAGCPLLIKTFVDSGRADLEDPQVQMVLQNELDMVLSGDPYENDILGANQADYLRCLCGVKSLRIDLRQMVMMRYSGFEFIKMLFDCPHLRADIETKNVWVYPFFRVMRVVNLCASWIGVFIFLLFTAAVILTAVNWFQSGPQKNNGYWTVICYVLGYVLMLVAVLRTEQAKIKQYEDSLWPFPNNNLVIFPAVPVYLIALVVTALRYELASDRARYFIIRYDLRNAVGAHLSIHGICHAIPQLIVQIFLFSEESTRTKTTREIVAFWLLVGSACASFFMAVFACARTVIFSHSCGVFGFAVMFVDTDEPDVGRKQRIKPSDIAARLLLFMSVAFVVAILVTFFVFLLNTSNCSAGVTVFLSVSVGVCGMTVVVMSLVLVYVDFSRWFGFFCVPTVICMLAYFPFTVVESRADALLPFPQRCYLLAYHFSSCMIPLFATFAAVSLSFLSWGGMVLFESITGERLQQQLIDNYMNL